MENGSAAAADGRRVGGTGGKSDVGLASAKNSGGYRLDVFSVGAGKQGRKREVDVVGLVGVVNVARKSNIVSEAETIGACGSSDAAADSRGGGS